MKTNELKKGQRVRLSTGWEATLEDNKRGNTRLAKVYGNYTEVGSVYAHDILQYKDKESGVWFQVEHTPAQLKLKEQVKVLMGGM